MERRTAANSYNVQRRTADTGRQRSKSAGQFGQVFSKKSNTHGLFHVKQERKSKNGSRFCGCHFYGFNKFDRMDIPLCELFILDLRNGIYILYGKFFHQKNDKIGQYCGIVLIDIIGSILEYIGTLKL